MCLEGGPADRPTEKGCGSSESVHTSIVMLLQHAPVLVFMPSIGELIERLRAYRKPAAIDVVLYASRALN